jgi:Concanavalin A-like lectin/glucanases superfamily
MWGAALMLSTAVLPVALAVPATESRLGAWPLDEGAGGVTADASGGGHVGRLGAVAGPDPHDPAWVAGRVGSALRFDGERNQFVAIGNNATIRPARISVEAWVRRLGTPGGWRYVFSGGASGCHAAPYGLYSGPGGGLAFYVSDASGYVLSPQAAPASVWNGAWHHAAGTYDGERVRLYLDGAEVGAGSPTDLEIAYGPTAGGASIGTYRGSCDLPYTGDVDEVALHGEALSSAQVAASARRTEKQPPPGPPPVTGPPGSSAAPPGAGAQPRAKSCLRVSVLPKTVKSGRTTPVRVTVRRAGRPAAGHSVTVRGAGVSKRARTGRKGRARLVVRPGRRGRLRVRASSQAPRCAARAVTLVAR